MQPGGQIIFAAELCSLSCAAWSHRLKDPEEFSFTRTDKYTDLDEMFTSYHEQTLVSQEHEKTLHALGETGWKAKQVLVEALCPIYHFKLEKPFSYC